MSTIVGTFKKNFNCLLSITFGDLCMNPKSKFQLKALSSCIQFSILFTCAGFISEVKADPITDNVEATKSSTPSVPNNANKMVFHQYPIMPNQGRRSAGRFGEFRSRSGGAGSHNGIDISRANGSDVILKAIGPGKIISYDTRSSGSNNTSTTNPLIMQMDTGDRIMYRHTDPRYQKQFNAFPGQRIKAGQDIAYMSNKGCGSCAVHLHIEYGVKGKRGLDVWLNKNLDQVFKNPSMALKQKIKGAAPYVGSSEYKLTDPTPYLPSDVVIVATPEGQALENKYVPYLGNTIRTQWNALYSSSTGITLPVGSSVDGVPVKQGRKLPALAFSGDVSMDAYGSAQVQVAQMIADGTISPEAAASGTIYANDVAQYAPPRTIFGGTADDVPFDIGALNSTPAELIENIGNGRYGNSKWFNELATMSMMGLLIEKLNIINAQNYLTKEIHKQNERLEALLAAYTSSETQRYSGSVDEIYARAEMPTVIPEVAVIEMKDIFENAENGNAPVYSDAQILKGGQGTPDRKCGWGVPGKFNAVKDGIKRVALKHGYNPNDVAAILGFESAGFNLAIDNGAGAYGLSQWTRIGLADIKTSDLTARGIPASIKTTPKQVTTLNAQQQTELLDLYLEIKSKQRRSDYNNKTIVGFYALVLGGPYKSPSLQYMQNKNLDRNPNDGVVTIPEAVTYEGIVKRLCPYYPDYP